MLPDKFLSISRLALFCLQLHFYMVLQQQKVGVRMLVMGLKPQQRNSEANARYHSLPNQKNYRTGRQFHRDSRTFDRRGLEPIIFKQPTHFPLKTEDREQEFFETTNEKHPPEEVLNNRCIHKDGQFLDTSLLYGPISSDLRLHFLINFFYPQLQINTPVQLFTSEIFKSCGKK